MHGGYDFDGSNSSRDLYVLTGWLPEKFNLKSDKRTVDTDKLWKKILTGVNNNDCLVTIGTGVIPDEDNVGLVGCHAYGILEVMEIMGHRMLLIKNPWGHFRWQGKFSYGDTKNWTPALKKALGYDNFSEDKGVFWMCWESLLDWSSHLDINWNPELLQYRKSFFDHWAAADMLKTHSLKDNPQYFIDFVADAQ